MAIDGNFRHGRGITIWNDVVVMKVTGRTTRLMVKEN